MVRGRRTRHFGSGGGVSQETLSQGGSNHRTAQLRLCGLPGRLLRGVSLPLRSGAQAVSAARTGARVLWAIAGSCALTPLFRIDWHRLSQRPEPGRNLHRMFSSRVDLPPPSRQSLPPDTRRRRRADRNSGNSHQVAPLSGMTVPQPAESSSARETRDTQLTCPGSHGVSPNFRGESAPVNPSAIFQPTELFP